MSAPDLARMKALALALLLGAAALYALATHLEGGHAAWGYVAAFAEAAMIGAVADWFAVVALFRHPLGLPIPHTAIIPSSKDRIGDKLAGFICSNFLGTQQVLGKLAQFDAAGRLAGWLGEPRNTQQVAAHLGSALRHAVDALDDERVQHFFRDTVLQRLEQVDFAALAGRLLDGLTAERRHQDVLDGALRQLARLLDDEALKARVAEAVAGEVKFLRYVGLDDVAGRYATNKLVNGLIGLVAEMADDGQHPLRLRFDDFMATVIARLQDDPALRLKGETLKAELLAHPALAAYLQGLWSELLDWTRRDLQADDSRVRGRLAQALAAAGRGLADDAGMRAWINEQVMAAAPRWIDRYREDIRRYIVARVHDWDAVEMTRELEAHIGRDLQFIRINGTLVGGLVGLAIHALTQVFRGG